jgi:TrmH family RNA methyltransferase
MITSLQNDRVKLAFGLLSGSRSRRKAGKIALEGVRLIRDAVEAGYIPDFLLEASPEIIRHVSATEQPQGVVGVFPMPTPSVPRTLQRVLILDALSDPGNMGTILRTAAAAGVDVVLLAPGCVDPYNDKALRGGMGAHFRIPVVAQSWDKIAITCDGLNVSLAAMDGDLAYDAADWTQNWALIIGSGTSAYHHSDGGGDGIIECGKRSSDHLIRSSTAGTLIINFTPEIIESSSIFIRLLKSFECLVCFDFSISNNFHENVSYLILGWMPSHHNSVCKLNPLCCFGSINPTSTALVLADIFLRNNPFRAVSIDFCLIHTSHFLQITGS